MALPKKLKAFQLFGDGNAWINEIPTLSLPELARNFTEYRGGGMDGPIMVDQGQNEIEFSWTIAGMLPEAYDTYGSPVHDAAQLRFAGSYESDEDGSVIPVEVVVRGRHKTFGSTDVTAGEDADTEVTTTCSYYKLVVDGQDLIEIDLPGLVFKVRGADRYAERRAAIGAS